MLALTHALGMCRNIHSASATPAPWPDEMWKWANMGEIEQHRGLAAFQHMRLLFKFTNHRI